MLRGPTGSRKGVFLGVRERLVRHNEEIGHFGMFCYYKKSLICWHLRQIQKYQKIKSVMCKNCSVLLRAGEIGLLK
jgi:hypothetical protein